MLEEFDKDYEMAGGAIPGGSYQAEIEGVTLYEKTYNGATTPVLAFKMIIISGGLMGFQFDRKTSITKKTLKIIKKDLGVLGLKLDRFSDLEKTNVAEQLLGVQVEIYVKENTEYPDNPNIYINKQIEADMSSDGDGNIPF